MDGANSRFSDDGETETTSIAATDVYIKYVDVFLLDIIVR